MSAAEHQHQPAAGNAGRAETRLNLVFSDACRNKPVRAQLPFCRAGAGQCTVRHADPFATRSAVPHRTGDGSHGLYTGTPAAANGQAGTCRSSKVLKGVVIGVGAASKGQRGRGWAAWMAISISSAVRPPLVAAPAAVQPAISKAAASELSFLGQHQEQRQSADFQAYRQNTAGAVRRAGCRWLAARRCCAGKRRSAAAPVSWWRRRKGRAQCSAIARIARKWWWCQRPARS